MTFEEIKALPPGTVVYECRSQTMIGKIVRGPVALCAYVGLPLDHPFAGMRHYDDIPVECHWGLTFSKEGNKSNPLWDEGYFWIGWDYGHCDDVVFYSSPIIGLENKKWVTEDVIPHLESVMMQAAEYAEIITSRINKEING